MSVYRRGDRWWVSVSVEGRRARRSAGPDATKADARQLEAQLRQALADDRPTATHTLDEAAERWWETSGQYMKGRSVRAQLRALLPYIDRRPN